MFNFTDIENQENEVVTSWFIKSEIKFESISYKLREDLYLQSNVTDGAWDTLLTKLKEVGKFDELKLEVQDVRLSGIQEEFLDPELDALLGVNNTPLFTNRKANKKAEVFCWINVNISSRFITGTLTRGIPVRVDAPRKILSLLLKASKGEITPTMECVGLHNPRIKEEVVLDLDALNQL